MADTVVSVALGKHSYPITIAPGLLGRCGSLLKPHIGPGKVLVIADAHVASLHAAALQKSLSAAGIASDLVTFPAGETSKSLATADQLWQACAARRIDRKDTIIAFGGGVSGDLAGFVAACWMRGVKFAQIPTSLLAMVDSSVGGKTGVNSAAGKNLIGAFKQPACVLIDPSLVASMDKREYRAGLAEVLKHGVIRSAEFFVWQEQNADKLAAMDAGAVTHAVAESCRIKAQYVAEDEFETGVRAHLNYGHTFGHALERETRYERYLHGEAVAIGMRMAASLAQSSGVLKDGKLIERQDALLKRFGLPLTHTAKDPSTEATKLAAHCKLDKKVAAGKTRFVLPTKLGQVEIVESPSDHAVAAAFAHAIGKA
jgi:3-dehydroquinate synthase